MKIKVIVSKATKIDTRNLCDYYAIEATASDAPVQHEIIPHKVQNLSVKFDVLVPQDSKAPFTLNDRFNVELLPEWLQEK